MTLRDIYNEAAVFFKWKQPEIVWSEDIFRQAILPVIHSYINSYKPESDRKLNFLLGTIALDVSDNTTGGLYEFDMSDEKTIKNLVEDAVIDNLGNNYSKATNRIIRAGTTFDVSSANEYNWDNNTLRIRKNIPETGPAASTVYVRAFMKLPVAGMNDLDLANPQDKYSVIKLIVDAAPEVYVTGVKYAVKLYNEEAAPKVEMFLAMFQAALDDCRRSEPVINEFNVQFENDIDINIDGQQLLSDRLQ